MNCLRHCTKCGLEKFEEEFRICRYKNGNQYFKSSCRLCEKLNSKKYVRLHQEERRKYRVNFTQSNPNYISNWKQLNRDKINLREVNRRKNDINFKLKKNIARRISHSICKNGNSTIKFLPYSIDELKNHLESLFDDKMSWDNYGDYWHIDHIVPHSTFKYISMKDAEFTKCWSLNNLLPLEASQNRLDGATRARHKRVEFATEYANNTI